MRRTDTIAQLRAFARYQTHAGYAWAAVMADGCLLCERCVLANYRAIFAATRDGDIWPRSDWQFVGLANSGEAVDGEHEQCAECNKTLWETQA